MTEYVTPIITSVLKKYQNSAPKSLQGPGHAAAVNCTLDASAIAGNGNDLVVSPCPFPNGKIQQTAQNHQTQPPAGVVALIKKEILSSPEPTHDELHGSAVVVTHQPAVVVAPPPPELSQPILSVADSGSGELFETRLEGKTIGCFSLGGEMRLCLPQFLNNVLNDFSLEQINRNVDELGIYCSQCTPDQLVEFKAAKILPSDVKASGLITRTDAERLCAALLHRSDRNSYIPVESLAKGAISFHVYHKCFGKCEGICTPDMYSYQKPTCIKCLECDGWFSPQKFVGHVHRKFENRTCHWGFDSRNWHDYLHVALDAENREKYQRILDQLREVELKEMTKALREMDHKKRKAEMLMDDALLAPLGLPPAATLTVAAAAAQTLPANLKHLRGGGGGDLLLDVSSKKHKGLDVAAAAAAAYHPLDIQRYQLMYAHCMQQQQQQQQRVAPQMSAFRPWGPNKSFLHAYNATAVALSTLPYACQEPPELQNPERVVRSTDRERFERTYQPNVALAPRKSILSKERDKERERERIDREREREIERQRRERERELQQLQQPGTQQPELHIKQERAATPQSPRQATPANEAEHAACNMPLSLSLSQQQQQQQQQRQACSTTSPTPQPHPQPKPVPAHLPPPPPSHHLQPQKRQLTPCTPCSPEQFGGSNEITSSTSPVPQAASRPQSQPQQPPPPPPSQHIIATVNQHAKLLPSSSSSSGGSSSSPNEANTSRIRINKNLMSGHMRSPTPPPLPPPHAASAAPVSAHQQQHSSAAYYHKPQPMQHPQQPHVQHLGYRQPHSPTQSSHAGLNLSTHSSNVVSSAKLPLGQHNGNKPHLGSEFELSTDTDDDSLNGEPDSSNMRPPWEMAVEALRDTRHKDRERVLHLLQRLLQENQQYRYNNMQLSELVHKQEAHIAELSEQLQLCRRQLDGLQQQQQLASECSRSSSSNSSARSSLSRLEIIKVPLQQAAAAAEDDDDEEEEDEEEQEQEQQQQQQQQQQLQEEAQRECAAPQVELEQSLDSDATMTADNVNNNNSQAESPLKCRQSNGLRRSATPCQQEEEQEQEDERPQSGKRLKLQTAAEEAEPLLNGNAQQRNGSRLNGNEQQSDSEQEAEDEEDEEEEEEPEQPHAAQAHSSALITPANGSTPTSPDSAATAGQLFDSSNSSDESTMKQAQMSASNALAKMSAADDVDAAARSRANEDDEDDEMPLQQRQHLLRRHSPAQAAVVTKPRHNYGHGQAHVLANKELAPRTLTLATKASKKQTPPTTTNCELQIKKEIA